MCWGFGLQEGWGIAISVDVLFIKYFAQMADKNLTCTEDKLNRQM